MSYFSSDTGPPAPTSNNNNTSQETNRPLTNLPFGVTPALAQHAISLGYDPYRLQSNEIELLQRLLLVEEKKRNQLRLEQQQQQQRSQSVQPSESTQPQLESTPARPMSMTPPPAQPQPSQLQQLQDQVQQMAQQLAQQQQYHDMRRQSDQILFNQATVSSSSSSMFDHRVSPLNHSGDDYLMHDDPAPYSVGMSLDDGPSIGTLPSDEQRQQNDGHNLDLMLSSNPMEDEHKQDDLDKHHDTNQQQSHMDPLNDSDQSNSEMQSSVPIHLDEDQPITDHHPSSTHTTSQSQSNGSLLDFLDDADPNSDLSDGSSSVASSDTDMDEETIDKSDASGQSVPADNAAVEYEVLKFVDRRPKQMFQDAIEFEYKVRWAGYSSAHDTWEPDVGVAGCTDALDEFNASLERKQRRAAKRLRAEIALDKLKRASSSPTPSATASSHKKSTSTTASKRRRSDDSDRTRTPSPPMKKKRRLKKPPSPAPDVDFNHEKMKLQAQLREKALARQRSLDETAEDDQSESAADGDQNCHLCNEPDSYPGNDILICDGCETYIHQHCYGVNEIPAGDWFCQACASSEKKADPSWKPKCVFCPISGGAFLRVYNDDGTLHGDGHEWAHVACAFFMEEVDVELDPKPNHPIGIYNYDRIYKERWKAKCDLCGETSRLNAAGELRGSAPIQCWLASDRTSWFHVLCARENRLPSKIQYVDCVIHHTDGETQHIVDSIGYSFCAKHCSHKWDQAEFEKTKRDEHNRIKAKERAKTQPKHPKLPKPPTPLEIQFAMAGPPKDREERTIREKMLLAEKAAIKDAEKSTNKIKAVTKPGLSKEDFEEEYQSESSSEDEKEEEWRKHRSKKTGHKLIKKRPPTTASSTTSTTTTAAVTIPSSSLIGRPAIKTPARTPIPKKSATTVGAGAVSSSTSKAPPPKPALPSQSRFTPSQPTVPGSESALAVTSYDPYQFARHMQLLRAASTTPARRDFLRTYFVNLPSKHKNLTIFGSKFLDIDANDGGLKILQTWLVDLMRLQRSLMPDEEELFTALVQSLIVLQQENPNHSSWKAEANAILVIIDRILKYSSQPRTFADRLTNALRFAPKNPNSIAPPTMNGKSIPPPSSTSARSLVKSEPRSSIDSNGTQAAATSSGLMDVDEPMLPQHNSRRAGATSSGTGHTTTKLRGSHNSVWAPTDDGERKPPAGMTQLHPDEMVPLHINPRTFESIQVVQSRSPTPILKKSALRKTKTPITIIELNEQGSEGNKDYAPGSIPYVKLPATRFQLPSIAPSKKGFKTRFPDSGLCSYQTAPTWTPGPNDSESEGEDAAVPLRQKKDHHRHPHQVKQQAHRTAPSTPQHAIRHGTSPVKPIAPTTTTTSIDNNSSSTSSNTIDYSGMPSLEPISTSSTLSVSLASTPLMSPPPTVTESNPPAIDPFPCSFFAQGKCFRGKDCNFSHAAVKPKPSTPTANDATKSSSPSATSTSKPATSSTTFNQPTPSNSRPIPLPSERKSPEKSYDSRDRDRDRERDRERERQRDRDREREREKERDRERERARDRERERERERERAREKDRSRERDRDRDRDRRSPNRIHSRSHSRSRSRSRERHDSRPSSYRSPMKRERSRSRERDHPPQNRSRARSPPHHSSPHRSSPQRPSTSVASVVDADLFAELLTYFPTAADVWTRPSTLCTMYRDRHGGRSFISETGHVSMKQFLEKFNDQLEWNRSAIGDLSDTPCRRRLSKNGSHNSSIPKPIAKPVNTNNGLLAQAGRVTPKPVTPPASSTSRGPIVPSPSIQPPPKNITPNLFAAAPTPPTTSSNTNNRPPSSTSIASLTPTTITSGLVQPSRVNMVPSTTPPILNIAPTIPTPTTTVTIPNEVNTVPSLF